MAAARRPVCAAFVEDRMMTDRARRALLVIALVTVLLGAGAALGTARAEAMVDFDLRTDYSVGDNPRSVVAGDFDGDGVTDLATADVSGTVSVLLGAGDGTFATAVTYDVGIMPWAVAVGDFDADGRQDLAVADVGDGVDIDSGRLRILLGDGDGTFQAAVSYQAGKLPYDVAVGDLDGDDRDDLAVAAVGGDEVEVLLSNPDGTLKPAVAYAAGLQPVAVAIGDLDGDGAADVAVANRGDGDVSVLLGNGDGTLQAKADFAVGTMPSGLSVGDLDGDAAPDLVTTDFGSDQVSVLPGNGDGTFQPRIASGAVADPQSVAVADLDGDGCEDLAVGAATGITFGVLLGNGDGTFAAPAEFRADARPGSVVAADLDGDGRPDLAAANGASFGPGTVSVLLQLAPPVRPVVLLPKTDYGAGPSPSSVACRDLDGDGDQDLAVSAFGTDPKTDPGSVGVLLGAGDGTFAARTPFTAGAQPADVAAGDFDRDGDPDLVTANYNDALLSLGGGSVSILGGNGDGTFGSPVGYPVLLGPTAVAAGDFNGDGYDDVVAVDQLAGWVFDPSKISVLINDGDGTFAPKVDYPAGYVADAVAIGDFDDDGSADLAVANGGDGDVGIYLGNGDGTFASAVTYGAGGIPSGVAVGDFDGDGDADLAVANGQSNDVSVLLGAGDGTFGPAADYRIGPLKDPDNWLSQGASCVTVGDYNTDGVPDLAVADYDAGTANVLLGRGDGRFHSPVAFGVGGHPVAAATADLDGDGRDDLAVANAGGGTVSILLQPADAFLLIPSVAPRLDGRPHGRIRPGGTVSVAIGGSQDFGLLPDPGYHVEWVTVAGTKVSPTPETTCTVSNVTADTTVTVKFRADSHRITASAGAGGSISPEGVVTVDDASDQTFTVTPAAGFFAREVLVDGEPVQLTDGVYTFTDVADDHTIAVSFVRTTVTFTLDRLPGGAAALTAWSPGASPPSAGARTPADPAPLAATELWRGSLDVGATQLAAGDLDGDGVSDAVLYTQRGRSAILQAVLAGGSQAARARGGSSGLFVLWRGRVPDGDTRIACGDADGDGAAEVWLSTRRGSLATVQLLGSSSDGSAARGGGLAPFAVAAVWSGRLSHGTGAPQVACGDVRGDGAASLVALDGDWHLARLEVWSLAVGHKAASASTSPATLVHEVWWTGPAQPFARLTVGDLTGDGRADAVVAGARLGGRMQISVSASTGAAFARPVAWARTGLTAAQLLGFAAGDADGDGRADLGLVRQEHRGAWSLSLAISDPAITGPELVYQYGSGLLQGLPVRLAMDGAVPPT